VNAIEQKRVELLKSNISQSTDLQDIKRLIELADTHKKEGKISQAKEVYKKINILAKRNGKDDLLALNLTNLAELHLKDTTADKQASAKEAMALLNQSMELLKNKDDHQFRVKTLLSFAFERLGKLDEALALALESSELMENKNPLVHAYSLLAVARLKKHMGLIYDVEQIVIYVSDIAKRITSEDKRLDLQHKVDMLAISIRKSDVTT